MKREEAIQLLSVLAQSLRSNPDQFSYAVEVSATGAQAVASAPGATGMSVTAVGGHGGNVTGANIRAEIKDADIGIARRQASEAERTEILSAAETIEAIAEELERGADDAGKLEQLLSGLSKLSVPVVIAVVTKAITEAAIAAAT